MRSHKWSFFQEAVLTTLWLPSMHLVYYLFYDSDPDYAVLHWLFNCLCILWKNEQCFLIHIYLPVSSIEKIIKKCSLRSQSVLIFCPKDIFFCLSKILEAFFKAIHVSNPMPQESIIISHIRHQKWARPRSIFIMKLDTNTEISYGKWEYGSEKWGKQQIGSSERRGGLVCDIISLLKKCVFA